MKKIRSTGTQTELDLEDRSKNVRGAFRIRSPGPILGRRVLLVDDVVTTGATVNACSEALLVAGASEVHVLAVASPYPGSEGLSFDDGFLGPQA